MGSMLLLEVDNIRVITEDSGVLLRRHPPRVILEDVSLTLNAGESLALLGESGGGKTTLARCIAGLHVPSQGVIRLEGKEVAEWRGALPVQMLFQNHTASLDPMMSVTEILQEGFEASGASASKEALAESLADVGLGEGMLDRFPGQLSGGERQRVALARVLAARPKLVIADEPTSALDRLNADSLLALLHALTTERRVALLHVTHDLSAAARTCRRAIVIQGGRVVDQGDWKTLRTSATHPATRMLMAAAMRSGEIASTI